MEGKIVVKIGGSNLKSIDSIQKIASVIKQYDQSPVIVVSAFYGITNLLIQVLDHALTDSDQVSAVIDEIKAKKYQAIEFYIKNNESQIQAKIEIDKLTNELRKYIYGINYIGEIPDFLYDKILSYGERLSACALSAIFNALNIKSEVLLPNDLGLITNGELANASIDFKASELALKLPVNNDITYIIPGFYGISPEGKVNLLGRGGTDYAAASVARLIKAKSLDVWKDVDGFLSVDPNIIDNPVPITHLSYSEAAELAYLGAKILHPRTVEPLIDMNIPIRIFNIEKENRSLKPLTTIDQNISSTQRSLKSITSSDQFGILKISGPGLGVKPGILAKITNRLYENNLNINSIISSHIAINLLLGNEDLKKAFALIEELNLQDIQELECIQNFSVIALVGQGILKNSAVVAQIFQVLTENEINIILSSLGASDVVCYILINKEKKDKCIKLIHQKLF